MNKKVGKKYRLRDNKALFALLPYCSIGWPCQLIYAIAKLSNQSYRLASSVLLSVLYIVWRSTFYFTGDSFQPNLLESLLRSQRNLDHVISVNHKLCQLHMMISILASITVIMPLVLSQNPFDPTVGMTSVVVFFQMCALGFVFWGFQAKYVSIKVQSILEESFSVSKDSRTLKIRDKIVSSQEKHVKQAVLQFTVYCLFGSFPYLWNKHDYLLPFAWAAADFSINAFIQSLVHEEKENPNKRLRGSTLPDQSGGTGSMKGADDAAIAPGDSAMVPAAVVVENDDA